MLLTIKHLQQPRPGECLAACAAMVLNYLGATVNYRRLAHTLAIVPGAGTGAFNIRRLETLGVSVTYRQGTIAALRTHLQNNQPCIVFVDTGQLPYWDESANHALVVVGLDKDYVYVHDPEFPNAPLQVSIGDFDLAWLEHDEMYAAITRR